MTFILPSFGASAISAVPASGGSSSGWSGNTYSLSLDGTDDYVEVADSDDFSFGDGSSNSAFSYSFWVRVESTSTFQHLISKGSSTNSEYLIQYSPGGYGFSANCIFFALFPGTTSGAIVVSPASSISANTWHHVVCTADGTGNRSGMKIYIDGVSQTLTASGATSLTMINSTDPLRFGARSQSSAPNSFLQGKMDEIALFNSELSSSNVTSIYNSGGPDDLASLSPVGWWRMGDNDGGTGTTITDQGSGGNDATLNNGPTYSTDVPVASSFNNTYSLSLDGSNDYAEVTGLNLSGATSWSTWVNPQSATTFNPLLINETGFFIDVGNGNFRAYIYDNANGGYLFRSYGLTLSTNTWQHLVITTDGSDTTGTGASASVKLYLNGSEVYTTGVSKNGTFTSFNSNTSNPMIIGGRTVTNQYSHHLVDEVAIFGSELSASDVTAIYNSGVAADLTSYSPVGWWRMGDNDSGTGTTITDQGSGGNDATLNNGPTFSTTVPS